jgi:hypothetical protein
MPPPYPPKRQPQVSIRYPFDSSFPPFPTTPVHFVADGNARPPGGQFFTVQGTLFDPAGAVAQSDPIMVNLTQGLWTMGPFNQAGGGGPMLLGSYLLVVRFLDNGVEVAVDVIDIQLA